MCEWFKKVWKEFMVLDEFESLAQGSCIEKYAVCCEG